VEEWAEIMGMKIHSIYTDGKGKQYLFDKESGKTIRIKPRRLLKIVKK
jgi:hypothetical protein